MPSVLLGLVLFWLSTSLYMKSGAEGSIKLMAASGSWGPSPPAGTKLLSLLLFRLLHWSLVCWSLTTLPGAALGSAAPWLASALSAALWLVPGPGISYQASLAAALNAARMAATAGKAARVLLLALLSCSGGRDLGASKNLILWLLSSA